MARNTLPILVVDDNIVNRLALDALLGRLDLATVVLDGGAPAVAAVERQRFATVLMDLVMPDVDGYEATRRIRRIEFGRGHHTPILAVTALGEEVEPACIAAGMDGLIHKPIDGTSL